MAFGLSAGSAALIGGGLSAVGSIAGGMMGADAASDAANTSAGASLYAADIQKQMYDQTRTDNAPWRKGGSNALERLLLGMGLQGQTLPTTKAGEEQGYDADKFNAIWNNLVASGTPWQTPAQAANLRTATEDAYQAQYGTPAAATAATETSTDPFAGSLTKKFTLADYEADPGYQFRLTEGQKGLDRSAAARGGLQSGTALKAAQRFGQDYASNEYGNAYNRYNTDQTTQYNRLASIAGLGQTANSANQAAGGNYANAVGGYAMTNAANQGNAALAGANSRGSAFSGIGNAFGRASYNWGQPSAGYTNYNLPDYSVQAGYGDRY